MPWHLRISSKYLCQTAIRPKVSSASQLRQHRRELSHNRDMVTLDTLRAERREEILRIAARHGTHNVRVFGSVARGDADEESDLDLLVAWEQGRSLLDHARLVEDLQELLGIKSMSAQRNRCTGTCTTRSFERLRRCEALQDAVIRNVEVIGEAATPGGLGAVSERRKTWLRVAP
jgi:predicted nucleotidyltransferase